MLESTTYPGTTRGEFLSALLAARTDGQLRLGEDFFVAYSPEREDPGRHDLSTRSIPKLVGGLDPLSTRLAAALYRKAVEVVIEVSAAEVAEAAKLLENVFRAVNIALVNELKLMLDAMRVDVWEVIAAAASKPFGYMPFYPGPGLGGHCIPIDPFYLAWKAKEVGCNARFIELAGEINAAMPGHVVNRIVLALNDHGLSVRGARVLVLGMAYKPDVDDTRESPSFPIITRLRAMGARVEYSDPHVPHASWDGDGGCWELDGIALTERSLRESDVVVVTTDHECFDYGMIAAHARIVLDTRNAFGRRGVRVTGDHIKA